MQHTITVAKSAGFCFGVDRAVKLAYEALQQHQTVATLGPSSITKMLWMIC